MNYTELRAALNAYMHRTDPETVDNEPVALELARLKLGRSFFPEMSGTPTVLNFVDDGDGTASAPLPTYFAQADVVYVAGKGDLEYLTAREFGRRWGDQNIGNGYTIGRLVARGAAWLATSTQVRMVYYASPDPIADNQSNWCSEFYADVWLWQALAEQHRFVQDGESAAMAEAYSQQLAGEAVTQTRANREGGALRMSAR